MELKDSVIYFFGGIFLLEPKIKTTGESKLKPMPEGVKQVK